MANAVIMPKAGITVESCIIGEWLKNVGDQINVGDILFTYETDKASFECESTAAGTLLEIFFEAGDEVPCLQNVCAIGNPGEDTSALDALFLEMVHEIVGTCVFRIFVAAVQPLSAFVHSEWASDLCYWSKAAGV